MSDESADLHVEIEARYAFVEDKDVFGILGLKEEAKTDEVRAAYFNVAKVFHPDKIDTSTLSPEEVTRARDIFEFVTLAFNTLSDPSRRASIIAARADGKDPFEGEKGFAKVKSDEARIFAHKGIKMLRMRAWGRAEHFFRESIARESNSVEVLNQLGWCLFNNTDRPEPARLEEARKCWMDALKLDASNGEANYYLSLFYKATGDVQRQKISLESALKHDPKNVEALREQRLLDMRTRSKTKEGILAKIFPSLVKK